MSAVVSNTPSNAEAARLILAMTPPNLPSDHRQAEERENATAAGRIRTLLDLLTTEKIDSLDRTARSSGGSGASSRWRNLRQRLGLIGCCGAATWRFGSSTFQNSDTDDENEVVLVEFQQQEGEEEARDSAVESGMNLAAALAAEREVRPPRTPLRRLLTAERSEVERVKEEREGGEDVVRCHNSSESVCCVCMERSKGAALIPCGHTYCRVCSREVWLNRGSCPLCNRSILEVLDIF